MTNAINKRNGYLSLSKSQTGDLVTDTDVCKF